MEHQDTLFKTTKKGTTTPSGEKWQKRHKIWVILALFAGEPGQYPDAWGIQKIWNKTGLHWNTIGKALNELKKEKLIKLVAKGGKNFSEKFYYITPIGIETYINHIKLGDR